MKFGKLDNLEGADLSMPADWPDNQLRIEQTPVSHGHHRFYLGGTGWSNKAWVGSVYPGGTRAQDFLSAYGKIFNCIELNTTHYRIPNSQQLKKWRDSVPEDFRFCPKILQRISHSKDLALTQKLPDSFFSAVNMLGVKLGPCFMQLPPYFQPNRLDLLDAFMKRYGVVTSMSVELRDPSWFEDKEAFSNLLERMTHYGVHTVITDVAGRRDVLHMGLSTRTVLIRFVGNHGHQSDYNRVSEWIKRLAKWWTLGLEDVYFFLHQSPPDEFVKLAQYLLQRIRETHLKVDIRTPAFYGTSQGKLF